MWVVLQLGLAGLVILVAPGEPSGRQQRPRDVVCRVPCGRKVVALTFDDGPHPVFTPQILSILAEAQVKATFFMIGQQVERYPEVARAVAEQGHAIGNHTYTHSKSFGNGTGFQVVSELARCQAAIERAARVRPYLFRPPRGRLNSLVATVVQDEGMDTILWSISGDHHEAPTPALMAKRVLNAVQPGGIILLHDGLYRSRWKDVAATRMIIKGLRKRGYRFVTVPELLAMRKEARATQDGGLTAPKPGAPGSASLLPRAVLPPRAKMMEPRTAR